MTQPLESNSISKANPHSRNPYLFVGGCPRSGTTLLQRMLDHHPRLAVANDTHFIPRALEKVSSSTYLRAAHGESVPLTDELRHEVWSYHRFYRMRLDRPTFDAIAQSSATYEALVGRLFDAFATSHGKELAGEKTPDYIRHVPLLLKMFPTTRMIHIVRDGRDTALSLLNWSTPTKGPGRLAWWSHDPIAVAALWWKRFVTAVDSSTAAEDRFVAVKYEDLLEQPELELNSLCKFLGLEYSPEMLNFHVDKHQRAANGSAKSRWLPVTKGLRDWRKTMEPDDVATFELLAGDALDLFGYERANRDPSSTAQRRANEALLGWQKKRPKPTGGQSSPATAGGDDEDIIRRETELRNLAILIRSDQFSEVAGRHLGRQPTLTANYLRYKKGRNCTVSYLDSTGQPWGYAVVHRKDALDKLASATRFLEKQSAGDAGFVDDDLQIVAFRFPHDPGLPGLAELLGEGQSDFVREILPDFTPPYSLRVLSYKPQRRCVLKVTGDNDRTAVLRVYQIDEYATARVANKQLAESEWYVAKRMKSSDRHRLIAAEWLEGQPWFSVGGDHDENRSRRLVHAGRWLATVHRSLNPKLPIVSLDDLLKSQEQAIEPLRELLPQFHEIIDQVADAVECSMMTETSHFAMSHGDFTPDQLLETSDGLAAIDWDSACNAPSGLDLGTFAAHWVLRTLSREQRSKEPSSPPDRTQLQSDVESFLAGYVEWGGKLPSNIHAFVAFGILQAATQPFRSRHPHWKQVTTQLIDEAQHWVRPAAAESHQTHHQSRSPYNPDLVVFNPAEVPIDDVGHRWIQPAVTAKVVAGRLNAIVRDNHDIKTGPISLESIRLRRYLRDRRCVVSYGFASESGESLEELIGKVRAKGVDLLAFENQRRISNAVGHRMTYLRVAHPLGLLPEWNLWLQTKLSGQSAESLLQPHTDTSAARRIGCALAELHNLRIQTPRTHSLTDELKILKDGFDRVCKKLPTWENDIRTVQQACEQLLLTVGEDNVTGIHRDFYPAQVLCDASIVNIVDFDLFATGHRSIDVGNFIAHLQESALRINGNVNSMRPHADAFLEGYRGLTDGSFPCLTEREVDILTFVSFARHIYISHRIRERRTQTRSIIEHCMKQARSLHCDDSFSSNSA